MEKFGISKVQANLFLGCTLIIQKDMRIITLCGLYSLTTSPLIQLGVSGASGARDLCLDKHILTFMQIIFNGDFCNSLRPHSIILFSICHQNLLKIRLLFSYYHGNASFRMSKLAFATFLCRNKTFYPPFSCCSTLHFYSDFRHPI